MGKANHERRLQLGWKLESEYNLIWTLENILPKGAFSRLFGKKKRSLASKLDEAFPPSERGIREMERVKGFDLGQFEKNYYRKGKPVILEGAAKDWECVRRWGPQFFADNYGDQMIDVQDDKYTDMGGQVDTVTVKEAVKMLLEDNRRYIRFNHFIARNQELLDMVDRGFKDCLKPFMLTKGSTQIFMGNTGTFTDLHAAMTNNMFIQVHGHKEFLLFHPSNSPYVKPICENSPTFRSTLKRNQLDALSGIRADLRAGDIMYLPPFYWHYACNHSFSIGLSYRWLAVLPSFRVSPIMTMLTAIATNPSPFLFMLEIKKGNSTPLWFRKQAAKAPAQKMDESELVAR